MTTIQRLKSDIATIEKRETADKTVRDNRIRNDELTEKRRSKADKKELAENTTENTKISNRLKNDVSTIEKRSKADKTLEKNRVRNDEITANRRETKDSNPSIAITVFLLMLLGFTFGAFIILV